MITVVSPQQAGEVSLAAREKELRVGLVPTMGFLHEGHLSLIRAAGKSCGFVVVSIFVNPIQFAPGEDLDRYPRDAERDESLCRAEGVDVVFRPEAGDMYGENHGVYVEETSLSAELCGASRPGHFRGVTTIVAKLFNIVRPDVAVFGLKDAQQARIIQKMVRDLCFPVEIVLAPIVREPDGLAMSSRNSYLSPEERSWAPRIYESLQAACALHDEGEKDARTLCEGVHAALGGGPAVSIDYISVVDWETLRPVDTITGKTLLAVAVKVGRTRLIDNVILNYADADAR